MRGSAQMQSLMSAVNRPGQQHRPLERGGPAVVVGVKWLNDSSMSPKHARLGLGRRHAVCAVRH